MSNEKSKKIVEVADKKESVKLDTKKKNNKLPKILIALLVLVPGCFMIIRDYATNDKLPEGNFNAIVDIVSPEVAVEVLGKTTDGNRNVKFTVSDNEGGSALYGLCISEYETVSSALDADPDCFELVSLESQISYEVVMELPVNNDGSNTIYYAYARDNFNNISEAALVEIFAK